MKSPIKLVCFGSFFFYKWENTKTMTLKGTLLKTLKILKILTRSLITKNKHLRMKFLGWTGLAIDFYFLDTSPNWPIIATINFSHPFRIHLNQLISELYGFYLPRKKKGSKENFSNEKLSYSENFQRVSLKDLSV